MTRLNEDDCVDDVSSFNVDLQKIRVVGARGHLVALVVDHEHQITVGVAAFVTFAELAKELQQQICVEYGLAQVRDRGAQLGLGVVLEILGAEFVVILDKPWQLEQSVAKLVDRAPAPKIVLGVFLEFKVRFHIVEVRGTGNIHPHVHMGTMDRNFLEDILSVVLPDPELDS